MRRFRTLVVLGVFCCGVLCPIKPARSAQDNITVADVTKAWFAREQSVKSFSVDWKVRHTYVKGSLSLPGAFGKKLNAQNLVAPPEDYTFEGSFSLKVDGKNVWYESTRQIWNMKDAKFNARVTTEVFDGTTNTVLVTGDTRGSSASIRPEPYALGLATQQTRAIALALRLSALPSSLLEMERLVMSPLKPTVNDIQCLALEDQRTSSTSTYCVDPAKGFSILRLSNQNPNGRTLRILDIDYSDHDGIWLPKSWHLSTFQSNGSLKEDTVAFEATYRLNESVQASEFQPKYPPKTLIVDGKNHKSDGATFSVITTDGTKRDVSRQEMRKTSFGELTSVKSTSTAVVLWASAAVLLSAAMICLAMFRKRFSSFKGEKQ